MLNHVSKAYGHQRGVDDLSYTFTHGVYGLLGANGAGKSTLMRLICALSKPTSGSITFDGQDVITLGGAYRQILGYLPQTFGFYPDLTVHAYLSYIATLKGLRPIVAKDRIGSLLNGVGLTDQAKTKMRHLSGGMVRRVGIAQALLNDPKVLILDEPTAGLDPNERVRFRGLISQLATDRIIVISTHIVADVDYLAHQLLLMQHGRLLDHGSTDTLISRMGEVVWEVRIPVNQVEHYRETALVSHIRVEGDRAFLRIIADRQPHRVAVPVAATLEDVCLYTFGGGLDA